ncbi:NADH-quinone oxidoreductase subunit C [Sphingobacterium sp. Lzh-3]|jgi:NADH-quinone oxidoreductase subunit C|uniref:NADH-quinone oxidoreductase subunit C n=1 Tax=unclassified Sphingobacterium TaxID=2609468 RepID=UPI002953B6BC|nr:NADH-quinone oxidoreductase subunit C [Sphingobacterium sp. UGAL515B_05]WON93919.1 NADH-quinone oxidoreductase subunit C [Sphingobacterium sp. UGAL515B_05]
MTFDEIKSTLVSIFGDQVIRKEDHTGLQPALFIDKADIVAVCLFLRDTEGLYFDFLSNLTAVDYEEHFTIVYHLNSLPYQQTIVLKVELSGNRALDELPEIPSVASVWRTADWHEREAFDLMGIFFEGHPDLRRILLPDDWDGYPLRKDYQEAEKYHGITIN